MSSISLPHDITAYNGVLLPSNIAEYFRRFPDDTRYYQDVYDMADSNEEYIVKDCVSQEQAVAKLRKLEKDAKDAGVA